MPKEALREHLKKLHTELESVENLDAELESLLRGVADDIEAVLGGGVADVQSGTAQLKDAAVKFEAEHPRLANLLGELADTVSKLGI